MGLTRIESEKQDCDNSAENIFNYLSDFNNFKSLMPPQVTDWNSTSDECSFVIKGMATIGMKIQNKVPHSKIEIVSHGKNPFNFALHVHLSETAPGKTTGQLVFEAELNPMLRMMVEKPLTNFFNMLAAKMKDIK